jgi:hypothetical protein
MFYVVCIVASSLKVIEFKLLSEKKLSAQLAIPVNQHFTLFALQP